MKDKKLRWEYRKERTRRKLRAAAGGLPRLSVHRSLKYLYAQIIDDAKGVTLVASSSRKKDSARASAKNVAAAKLVGREVAQKALSAGIKQVVFDRGGSVYHGRLKALADAAREAGLKI